MFTTTLQNPWKLIIKLHVVLIINTYYLIKRSYTVPCISLCIHFMHFQWKIKWRPEHLGELRIMGETAPLIALHFPTKDTILTWFLDGRRTSFWQAVIDMQRRHAFLSSSKDNKTEQFLPHFYQKPEKRELSWTLSLPKVNFTKPRKLLSPELSNET